MQLTHFIGCYQWTASDGTAFLRFCYAARPLSHDPAQPLDTGIDRALWLTPAELQAAGERQRSPLVWQVVADYLRPAPSAFAGPGGRMSTPRVMVGVSGGVDFRRGLAPGTAGRGRGRPVHAELGRRRQR